MILDCKLRLLEQNVKDFDVTYFGMTDDRQGIVHVVGPEQGFTLPGTTVVVVTPILLPWCLWFIGFWYWYF